MKTLLTHTVTSNKNFKQTVDELVQKIETNSFKVLHVHDVQATFAGKGIEHGPYKIVEFCRAPAAKKVLDVDPAIGLFLPCRAVVFEQDGVVQVMAMSPTVVRDYFPDTDLGDLPERIDAEIAQIISSLNS